MRGSCSRSLPSGFRRAAAPQGSVPRGDDAQSRPETNALRFHEGASPQKGARRMGGRALVKRLGLGVSKVDWTTTFDFVCKRCSANAALPFQKGCCEHKNKKGSLSAAPLSMPLSLARRARNLLSLSLSKDSQPVVSLWLEGLVTCCPSLARRARNLLSLVRAKGSKPAVSRRLVTCCLSQSRWTWTR